MTQREQRLLVVTGGGSGIGLQIATEISMVGDQVVIVGRNQKKMESAIMQLKSENHPCSNRLIPMACDISNEAQVEKLFAAIRDQLGPVHGLVNNAGVNPSRNTAINTTSAHWHETISTNLTGAFYCSKYAIKHMMKRKAGTIVMVSSIAGINGMKKRCAYSVSKWGLIGLAKSLAIDFAQYNIRVNTVCPGYVKTELVAGFLSQLSSEAHDELQNLHALGRFGLPQDVAKAVKFLLSEDADWITGAVLPVDGGYSVGKHV